MKTIEGKFINKLRNVYATVFQLSGYDKNQLKEKEDVMCEFLQSQFSEILDSLVMEELKNTKDESTSDWFYGYGWNACREELLSRINKIKANLKIC